MRNSILHLALVLECVVVPNTSFAPIAAKATPGSSAKAGANSTALTARQIEAIRALIESKMKTRRVPDDDPRALIPYRARGYVIRDSVLQNSRWSDMSSKMAAGGWLTTPGDLVRFMQAWMAGKLVSRADMTYMLDTLRLNGGGTVDNFGHGWFIDDYHGMKAGLYGGGTAQVTGVVFFVPDRQLAIAGLFNLENVTGPERIALAEAIADVVLGEKTANADHFSPH